MSAAVTKIAVKSVELERAEGPVEECVKVALEGPDSLETAQAVLAKWGLTAPEKGGGYDKCDFKVTFEDGETSEGRYDRQNTGLNDSGETIAGQMKNFLGFLAGTKRPAWMSDKQWADAQKRHADDAAGAKEFLDKYEF
jgi:hypothetical protein